VKPSCRLAPFALACALACASASAAPASINGVVSPANGADSAAGPSPVLLVEPQRLEPTGAGVKGPLSFSLSGSAGLDRIRSWRLDIVAPDGELFRSFSGDWPLSGDPEPQLWDGRSASGAFARPASRYAAILSLSDSGGRSASTQLWVTVSDLPDEPGRCSVQPWSSGFSPNGDKVMDTMSFSLGFGERASVRSWRLDIAHADKGLVRSFRGRAPDLPESLVWDGRTGEGEGGASSIAPEGRYSATLVVDYDGRYCVEREKSAPFVLETAAPSLDIACSPELFSPDEKASVLSMGLSASSAYGRLVDWSIEVLDPGGQVFARFGGPYPASGSPAPIAWDGVGTSGGLVDSAERYRVVARVRDEFGNRAARESGFDTDILLAKEGARYRVDVASILFRGNTADFENVGPEQAAKNRRTLDALAAKFAKYPDYRIRIVGHAVMTNWDDPELGGREQRDSLVPLSRARAAAIAKALAERGIASSRMSVEGVGAKDQVVPDSDLANRWKNRRVEFFLERK
jgi:Outer membrane protein and related peptidoglycan-associated (lipo)proteins